MDDPDSVIITTIHSYLFPEGSNTVNSKSDFFRYKKNENFYIRFY